MSDYEYIGDFAHELIEQSITELSARIEDVYTQAAAEMQQTVDDYFDAFKKRDEDQRALMQSGQLSKEEYSAWRQNQFARGERYQQMADTLAEQALYADEIATSYINDEMPSVYSTARSYSSYTIEKLDSSADFNLWDEYSVRRLLIGEDYASMPHYPAQKAVNRGIDLQYGKQQIHASVLSGILQGKSISQIADDLMKRIQNMSRTSALRAARTAMTEAENAGRQDCYDEAKDMGIEMQKQWLATPDERTRPDHAAADGQAVDTDAFFIVGGESLFYPGDPSGSPAQIYNCRCTTIAKLKDVDEGDTYRWSPDYSYEDWLKDKEAEANAEAEAEAEEAAGTYRTFDSLEDSMRGLEDDDYNEWYDGLDYDERDSLESYTGSSYEAVNDYLRTGYVEGEEDYTQWLIENTEQSISEYTLSQGLTVYRGTSYDFIQEENLKVGSVFHDEGFTSTSTVSSAQFPGSTKMVIHVPAGTGAGAYLAEISQFENESEFLLQRGSDFLIDSIRTDEDPWGDTITYVECTLIGASGQTLEFEDIPFS